MQIPNYQITQQSIDPEEIVDIIPEQEKVDRQVQASEEKYFQQLKQVGEDKLRQQEKMWNGLSKLSSKIGELEV